MVIFKPFWVEDLDKTLLSFVPNFRKLLRCEHEPMLYAKYAYLSILSLTKDILGACSADFLIKSEQSENSTNESVFAGEAYAYLIKNMSAVHAYINK